VCLWDTRCVFLSFSSVSFQERNRLCIFPGPIQIPHSPFAWKYYLLKKPLIWFFLDWSLVVGEQSVDGCRLTLQQKAEGSFISISCLRFLARARLPSFSRTACVCVLERAERESTGGTERKRLCVYMCVCAYEVCA